MEAVGAEADGAHESRRSVFAWIGELLAPHNLALDAAALLVIGLLSWSMLLRGEVQDLQGRVQSLQSQPQEPQMVALKGPGAEHGARAEVMILHNERAALMAEDMPPVPEGKTYQIWVIEGDVMKPSGLFKPKQDSVAAVVEQSVGGDDVIAVTVEPEGGSPQPTTKLTLEAKV